MTFFAKLIEVSDLFFIVPFSITIILLATMLTITYVIVYPIHRLFDLCRPLWSNSKTKTKPKIIVLGTGWGCYSMLKSLQLEAFDITIISPRDHFIFTPLLCGSTVGTVEARSITEPVGCGFLGNNVSFLCGRASEIDFGRKIVRYRCSDTDLIEEVRYDKLVIGVGAKTNTFGVDGAPNYSFFLKEISDGQEIRKRLLSNVNTAVNSSDQQSDLLKIVIVGGGPTGVELAAEVWDFLRQATAQQGKAFEICIIERSALLASFPPALRKYVKKELHERVNVRIIHSAVAEVQPNGVTLINGTFINAGLIIWTAGIAQHEFTKSLDVPKNDAGQILVDNDLSILDENFKNEVFALGDCSQLAENSLPCSAQVAMQQGKHLAESLNNWASADFSKTALTNRPFKYKPLGLMAYIGNYRAVASLDMVNTNLTGFCAFAMWRFGYLFRLFSWRQRLQVSIDWFKTFVFGRDVSTF